MNKFAVRYTPIDFDGDPDLFEEQEIVVEAESEAEAISMVQDAIARSIYAYQVVG